MASVLLGYGCVLVGFGLWLRQFVFEFGGILSIACLAGGVLSTVWAIAALKGAKGRTRAFLTLLAAVLVMLHQTVHVWMDSNVTSLAVRLLVTAVLVLTIGILAYLLHGERPPEFYVGGALQRGDSSAMANDAQSQNERPQQ